MTAPTIDRCAVAADLIAERLAVPPSLPPGGRWRHQSLWTGVAGIALLHIERAHAGLGSWRSAHTWVTAATQGAISAADTSGLHAGVTAVAFVLHAADADGGDRYAAARKVLDRQVDALAYRRVDQAVARLNHGAALAFAEYDLLHGLTGIGAHLLRHNPTSTALPRILDYLVRLTQPCTDGRPGWWVAHGPDQVHSGRFAAGHANLGIAHGITGPLALLAHALRRGMVVDGHIAAIDTICAKLDRWRHANGGNSWWPQWLTHNELIHERPVQTRPGRPSWCYGTPGLARAQQLAAIATGDRVRQHLAEAAIASAMADADRLSDAGLCHGLGGLYQTAWRAAADSASPAVATHLPAVAQILADRATTEADSDGWLLEGDAGVALALHTAAQQTPPVSGWDACLLIT